MLKLSETRTAYEDASSKLSDINRQLCFAGFGIIWLYNMTDTGVEVPRELYLPGLLLVLSMVFDVFQYIYTTMSWAIFYHEKASTKQHENDITIIEPKYFNAPSWVLFACKIVAMTVAYVYLGIFLYSQYNQQ